MNPRKYNTYCYLKKTMWREMEKYHNSAITFKIYLRLLGCTRVITSRDPFARDSRNVFTSRSVIDFQKGIGFGNSCVMFSWNSNIAHDRWMNALSFLVGTYSSSSRLRPNVFGHLGGVKNNLFLESVSKLESNLWLIRYSSTMVVHFKVS